ncbi:MAG: hypothetical protein M5U33_09565 [Pseudorhodoplanes sp.]|nr:hypothetical protein [Pseudorhodoplanes sp.]
MAAWRQLGRQDDARKIEHRRLVGTCRDQDAFKSGIVQRLRHAPRQTIMRKATDRFGQAVPRRTLHEDRGGACGIMQDTGKSARRKRGARLGRQGFDGGRAINHCGLDGNAVRGRGRPRDARPVAAGKIEKPRRARLKPPDGEGCQGCGIAVRRVPHRQSLPRARPSAVLTSDRQNRQVADIGKARMRGNGARRIGACH